MKIGVLAFQGSVAEHMRATREAAEKLDLDCDVVEVRTKDALAPLDGLIIPGGESTTIYKLCMREGMLDALRCVKGIFGTCAGAIMLAKKIHNEEAGQKSLGLMDIEIDRNAYGRQAESFEEDLETVLGTLHAVFIRAPRIVSIARSVEPLAMRDGEVLTCEQRSGRRYYLAACFHPELSTTLFHEHFLKNL